MKAVTYRHSWSSNLTREQGREQEFGTLLHEEDTSAAYEVESAHLYRDEDRYTLLEANGCSCWDGDYDGWEFTKDELMVWAKKKIQDNGYRERADELLAKWILQNEESI